jgi:hypothetical protein
MERHKTVPYKFANWADGLKPIPTVRPHSGSLLPPQKYALLQAWFTVVKFDLANLASKIIAGNFAPPEATTKLFC